MTQILASAAVDHRRRATCPRACTAVAVSLLAIVGIVRSARAAGGAYLVDDASIAPANHCQLESWVQARTGGRTQITAQPACSVGPLQWQVGIVMPSRGTRRQATPALKWMVRDPEKYPWGLAVQAAVTARPGQVLSSSAYAAVTANLDAARRWTLSADVGGQQDEKSRWNPLAGAGLAFNLSASVSVLIEHLRAAREGFVTQAGVRWALGRNSIDVLAGRHGGKEHDRWVTFGLNLAF